MIELDVFPGGKRRIVTFSYDDGPLADERLIGLFDLYGVRGTFHLNSSRWQELDDSALAAIVERYRGHEIAAHTVHHGLPDQMPAASLVRETLEDRLFLEKLAGYPVVGMSYPNGDYDEGTVAAMRSCGIVYSRTTKSTRRFDMPADFMQWHPTCHHRDALTLADTFLDTIDSPFQHPLFYIWGHAFEFRTEADWDYMEKVLQKVSGLDNVWYATNVEIYDYVQASRRLTVSADETIFRNPSDTDVWVERNNTEILCIPAGKTVTL